LQETVQLVAPVAEPAEHPFRAQAQPAGRLRRARPIQFQDQRLGSPLEPSPIGAEATAKSEYSGNQAQKP